MTDTETLTAQQLAHMCECSTTSIYRAINGDGYRGVKLKAHRVGAYKGKKPRYKIRKEDAHEFFTAAMEMLPVHDGDDPSMTAAGRGK